MATLVSPTGAYGGPTRVAANQIRALRQVGHDAVLAAAASGYQGSLPKTYDGVPAELFPARTLIPGTGFAGLSSPSLQRWLRTELKSLDVLHIHLSRDLVTLPAAMLARARGIPYVLQTHGMVDPSSNPLSIPLDRFLTLKVLRSAQRIFYLTATEKRGLEAVGGGSLPLAEMKNGHDLEPLPASAGTETGLRVLFLARLHARKRPTFFAEMAVRLRPSNPTARFALVGPDEGEADKVGTVIARHNAAEYLAWEGPLAPEETSARMADCDIYVLPSVDEPYPMSVIEAMSLGKPVVVTESCGLAPMVRQYSAGVVVDETLESLIAGVTHLMNDSQGRARAGGQARLAARENFNMNSVRARLEREYEVAVQKRHNQ